VDRYLGCLQLGLALHAFTNRQKTEMDYTLTDLEGSAREFVTVNVRERYQQIYENGWTPEIRARYRNLDEQLPRLLEQHIKNAEKVVKTLSRQTYGVDGNPWGDEFRTKQLKELNRIKKECNSCFETYQRNRKGGRNSAGCDQLRDLAMRVEKAMWRAGGGGQLGNQNLFLRKVEIGTFSRGN
jgi:hypothetical protein